MRVDYNLTSAHRLSFSDRYNDFNSAPDFLNSAEPTFPGFPNLAGQISGRYMWQGVVRSTLGKNMVNEVRVGQQDAIGHGHLLRRGRRRVACSTARASAARAPAGKGWNFGVPEPRR